MTTEAAPSGEGPETTSPAPPPPTLGRRLLRSLVEWVVIVALSLGFVLLLRAFVVQPFLIPSSSMEPTLEVGDRVLVNKLTYLRRDVERGDIVVFVRPECDRRPGQIKDLIKRVVATSGDTVAARNGQLLVNGEQVAEPYLTNHSGTGDFGPVEVPEGEFWAMGDNRANSTDSRFLCGGNTTVPVDNVIGRAFVTMWPPSEWGRL